MGKKKNAVIKAKSKNEIVDYQEREEKEQWSSGALTHLQKINQIAKPDLKKPAEIIRACDSYFSLCKQDNQKPTMSGLALALGTNRRTLLKWYSGETRIYNREIIQQYFDLLETFDELMLKEGKINPVSALFIMKNNYGYTDKTEIKVSDEEISNEEIERRYREQHEIVSESEENKDD